MPPTKPLYRKLRPHPNGPPRAAVTANQRARIHGALLEANAIHGYARVSVAELCRLAGVSKRAFYEQFHNKEDCFQAGYDNVLRCALDRVGRAAEACADPDRRPAAMLEALFTLVRERPLEARLVLCDPRPRRPGAPTPHGRSRRELERVIVGQFHGQAPIPPLIHHAIVAGIEHVLRRGMASDTDGCRLASLELARWASAYCSPAHSELPTNVPRAAPEREQMPSDRARSERVRVLYAIAEIAASDGDARITPAMIAWRAGVEEQNIDAFCGSSTEAILAAFDQIGMEALMQAAAAPGRDDDGATAVYLALAALMERLAFDPALRAVVFSDIFVAGSGAEARRDRLVRGFACAFLKRHPCGAVGSEVVAEATAGALWGCVENRIRAGAAHQLPACAPQIAFTALAPLVGAESAVAAIHAGARRRLREPHREPATG